MVNRYLFVDFENVRLLEPTQVPEDTHVIVFLGANQTRVPAELVEKAQPLGNRLKWRMVAASGKNALDFHIAYYMGALGQRHRGAEFVVLSRDTGFDPLIKHLQARKIKARRIEELDALMPRAAKVAPAAAPHRRDPNITSSRLPVLSMVAKGSKPRPRAPVAAAG